MKQSTHNEYEKAVNRVIDYINRHLFDNPDLNRLSGIANIPEFHFHRIFKTIIGENIGEYIYRLNGGECFEKYLNNPDKVPAEELLTEIYVPVVKQI